MHYHVEIHFPTMPSCIEDAAAEVLAPFNDETAAHEDDRHWDWYQIGARWANAHDPSYDPEKDPRNQEPCAIPYCQGNDCYRCHGTGIAVKWPTSWVIPECVLIPLAKVDPTLTASAVVRDGVWHDLDKGDTVRAFFGDDSLSGFLLTVDCHD